MREAIRDRRAGLIMIAILSIWILEYSTYLVTSGFWDAVVKVAMLGPLVFYATRHPPGRCYRTVFWLYGALFMTTALGAATQLDVVGILQLAKVVLGFLTLMIVLGMVPPGEEPPGRMLKMPIFWGVLFAIQAIALASILLSGRFPHSELIIIPRLGDTYKQASGGILGLGVLDKDWGYYHQRAQGWFVEPSILGSFMIYPTVVAFGYFWQTKRVRFLLFSVVCLAGLCLTVSLAAIFGLIAAMLTLAVFRPVKKKIRKKRSTWALIRMGLVIAAFIWLANAGLQRLYSLRQTDGKGTTPGYLLGRDDDQTLIRAGSKLDVTSDLLRTHPLGIGLGGTLGTSEVTSASAFLYWIQAGGVLAGFVLFALYGTLFFRFCYPALQSRNAVYRSVAASFLGLTVHNLSYGTWLAPYYLFGVGVMMICGETARRMAEAPPPVAPAAETAH